MTIDELGRMTARGFRDTEKRLGDKIDGLWNDMKAGFQLVLEEMRGFREETKIGLQAMRIEYAELRERVENLEKRMSRVEATARR